MDATLTGAFIRAERTKKGLSQQKLAEMLFVEPQTISKWERGLGLPDYDNLFRLKDIFGCSISDLLEPDPAVIPDHAEEETEEDPHATDLPVLEQILNEGEQTKNGKKKFRLFDYLNRKKITETVEKLFGYEYVSVYNQKFLFRDLLRRRSKKDYEDTLSQGAFTDNSSHTVLGLCAPWLYTRVFLFLLICCIPAFFASFFLGTPIYAILFTGLLSIVPLTVFLFESNFSRNVTIFDVLKYGLIGGVCSIVLTLLLSISGDLPEVIQAVLIGPLTEEIAKAIITVLILAFLKPKDLLTGLLIGFTVGAGFDLFENYQYAVNIYGAYMYYGAPEDALVDSLSNIILRSFYSFFSGHHYYTAIFGGLYVFGKKNRECNIRECFTPFALAGLGIGVALHMLWNASTYFSIGFFASLTRILVGVLCIAALILLLNIGIAQKQLMEIYETTKGDEIPAACAEENGN